MKKYSILLLLLMGNEIISLAVLTAAVFMGLADIARASKGRI